MTINELQKTLLWWFPAPPQSFFNFSPKSLLHGWQRRAGAGSPACIPKPGKAWPTKAGVLEKKLEHHPKSQCVMLMHGEIKWHRAEALAFGDLAPGNEIEVKYCVFSDF